MTLERTLEYRKNKWIEESTKIHKGIYDYSLINYTNARAEVEIICSKHGSFFQPAHNHKIGFGCKKCSFEKHSINQTKTTEWFIEKSIKVHGDLYDYSLSKYLGANKKKVEIICSIHGPFWQWSSDHICGSICPHCSDEKVAYNWYKNQTTWIYYAKINNLWKIGLRKGSFSRRYNADLKDGHKIVEISSKLFEDGYDAWELEQKILNHYKNYSYNGPKFMKGGEGECFVVDIFQLPTIDT